MPFVTIHFRSDASRLWLQVADDSAGEPLERGTRVTLHLKEDALEMASATKLSSLIHQYSQFIQFPINLWTTRQETEEVRSYLAGFVDDVCGVPANAANLCTLSWSADFFLKLGSAASVPPTCQQLSSSFRATLSASSYQHPGQTPKGSLASSCNPDGAAGMQVVDEEKTKTKQEEADKAAKEKGEDKAAAVAPEMKSSSKDVWDWAVQNDSKPLWTRSPKQVRRGWLPAQ